MKPTHACPHHGKFLFFKHLLLGGGRGREGGDVEVTGQFSPTVWLKPKSSGCAARTSTCRATSVTSTEAFS